MINIAGSSDIGTVARVDLSIWYSTSTDTGQQQSGAWQAYTSCV
jgi:hypothetical protein